MPLVNMKPLLRDAMDNGYAVAAFNLVDYGTTKAMVAAAEELNAPVICQTSAKINISTNLKHVFVQSFVDYHTAKPTDFEPLRLIDAQYQACKAMFGAFIEKFGGKDRAPAYLAKAA